MSKPLREAWIYAGTDGLWKLALDAKYVWSNTPEKLKVREVSAEYDAAAKSLLSEIEFLNSQELLNKICGPRLLRALKRFEDVAKGLT